MATAEEIANLRELIDEPDDSNGWTDLKLGEVIDSTRNSDSSADLNAAASDVWLSKATTYSKLVDVSESGSSRKMSDLYKNAIQLSGVFAGKATPETTDLLRTRPRTRAIVRP